MNFRALLFFVALATSYQTAAGQLFPGFPGIKDLIGGISKVIGRFDDNLTNLIGDVKNFTRSLQEVAECYEAQLQGQEFNIFNGSVNFKNVVAQYYKAFPNKTINAESIKNLLDSTRDIITRCIDPARRSSAKFGFTELSDKSLDDIKALLGTQQPAEPSRAKRLSGGDSQCQVTTSTSLPSTFDWRSMNYVTPVKNQGQCGSCWTFATAGSIESMLLIKQKTTNRNLDLSEQQMVNCAKPGGQGCQGGYSQLSFTYAKDNGLPFESANPYTASEQSCNMGVQSINPIINDFCVRSKYRYTYSSVAEQLDDDTMMRALQQNGPLYITLDAGSPGYQNYRGGILDTTGCTTNINHAVLLVGYDSNSWIIKNSWGTWWGENGYFRLPRGQNACGVNTEIAWPIIY